MAAGGFATGFSFAFASCVFVDLTADFSDFAETTGIAETLTGDTGTDAIASFIPERLTVDLEPSALRR